MIYSTVLKVVLLFIDIIAMLTALDDDGKAGNRGIVLATMLTMALVAILMFETIYIK
ncbi:MAG: hypothetical protein IJI25_08905 [Eubacterium sp.]|nr:hypothetical protein [Eubacterium sp.]